MNRIYIIILAVVIFFLGLYYWSVGWLFVGVAAGSIFGFYQFHLSRIQRTEALKEEVELQLEEKTDLLELVLERENKAKLQAEQANKTKTTILAKISHEIRTPLNGMMGMASLLAETGLNTEQKEYAEMIRHCGESLLEVINGILIEDILAFSRMDASKAELAQKDFDLYNCVEEVLDMFAGKATDAGLELLYEISSGTPAKINGDALRFRQILMNLLSNAVNFTHRGEILLLIRSEKTARPDELLLKVELRDTGIGIEQDKLERILQSLRYSKAVAVTGQRDSSLGLIICEQLINLMGGNLEIDSSFGKGTSVTFTLIMKNAVQLQRADKNLLMPQNQKNKILIVDKNSSCVSILKTYMEEWGLQVATASSGLQALAILEGLEKPALVIADMLTAAMDGVELTATIHSKWPRIPVILLVPLGDQRWKKQEQQFAAVINKPVKKQVVGKAVSRLLSGDKNHSQGPSKTSQVLREDFALEFPLRILIAEDDMFNQQLAVKILNKLGYQPHIASNGKEVLEILGASNYDLVLMDVQMPEMDGLEATRMIRLCLTTQPVIVAMTANAMQGDKEACMQAGMDDYICKPAELSELVRVLERWAIPAVNS